MLVRFDQGKSNPSFDYLEFTLAPNRSGQYQVVDGYLLSNGQMQSVVVGTMMKLMTDPDPDFLHRFFGVTQFKNDTVAAIRHIGELQKQGKYADALGELNQLPAEWAETREMLWLRATNAKRANNRLCGLKNYPQAVEALRTLQTRFGVKLDRQRIASSPRFAGLVQSDAFRQWMSQ